MARILFTWELGGDYGHLAQLLPIARELARRGHEPVFAIRDLLGAETILKGEGFAWFQAPLWLAQVTNLPPPISLPEVLMRFGFLNGKALTGICRAWRNLIQLIQPDLIICEHSPTALVALRGLGIPVLVMGYGFSVPPAFEPLPPFDWWGTKSPIRVRDSETRALQSINEALENLNARPLVALHELFSGDRQALCSFKELDHYPTRITGHYLGPVFSSLARGKTVHWPDAEGPKIFAYIKTGYPHLAEVLRALRDFPASVIAHVPHAAKQMIQQYSSRTMTVELEPLDMDAVVEACDFGVTHGGAGTTAALLLAGRPLLLMPTQSEQLMLAKRLQDQGVGVLADPRMKHNFTELLRTVTGDAKLKASAQAFADRYSHYNSVEAVNTIADYSEELLCPHGSGPSSDCQAP